MLKRFLPVLITLMIITTTMACDYTYTWGYPSTEEVTTKPTHTPLATQAKLEKTPITSPPIATQKPVSAPPEDPLLNQFEQTLTTLYEYASPGVVTIQVLTNQGAGLGSGFVYDDQGHIITNYHVVQDVQEVEVDFPSGIKTYGEVIGTDLDSDLAVIKVNVDKQYLKPLPLGDSDTVKVGQTVVAIGNPFYLKGSMTMGIISAKGRTLESSHQTAEGAFFSSGDILQTDASINPGNSGGPLLDLNGKVIGVNYMIRTTGTTITGDPVNSGIGFAISINIVKRVVPILIKNGHYDYPFMGITARSELSLMEQQSLNVDYPTGAYIISVTPGGPADEAGLKGGDKLTDITGLPRGGDLIIAVDGKPVYEFGDLLSYIMIYKTPGDQITLTIIRDGEKKELTLTLDKRP